MLSWLLSVPFLINISGKGTDTVGLEKSRRINFSLGRWSTWGKQNAQIGEETCQLSRGTCQNFFSFTIVAVGITRLEGNNRVYRWYGCWLVITYQERGLLNLPPTWHTGPPSVRRLRSIIWPLPHGGWAGGWARDFHSLHSHIPHGRWESGLPCNHCVFRRDMTSDPGLTSLFFN